MVTDVEWAAFVPSALLLAATPGANQLLTLRNGLRHGLAPAVSASLGRFTAFALMVVAVAAGLGAVLAASEVAFNVIKWCGVVYLLWLGARTVLTALRGQDRAEAAPDAGRDAAARSAGGGHRSSWRLAWQEFLVAATNPKALILFTVFLPQFLPRGAEGVAVPLLALGTAYIAIEFCCACGCATLGSRLKSMGIGRRARRRLDGLTGGAMLGLAAWLATENH
ncbi:LysE family translocator [Streptomyces aurantiacus]|uniref:Putative Homoserine/homoserine lactone efflux protein n=1 Tax=Streptomyces aurantiacus JA 4570 TaxID=1286094 RepID=S3ZL32_9ACTN|nr:LysE family translocator [Streptomyces aurantiacus]EPH44221.1 putative Homoserine/homoserine lactone efflux protein [Streptomyces aurantiacus JA 4570]